LASFFNYNIYSLSCLVDVEDDNSDREDFLSFCNIDLRLIFY